MKFEVTERGVWRNYIDTENSNEMQEFINVDVMCALEEKTNFDEEEIAVILELLLEDQDWEKAISIMQSCRFHFEVKVPPTSLDSLI